MPAEDTQDHPPQTAKAPGLLRWLTPAACLFALAGYFAPWVDNRVAGLVITGLDLGEYVKFLPAVRNGVISIRDRASTSPGRREPQLFVIATVVCGASHCR